MSAAPIERPEFLRGEGRGAVVPSARERVANGKRIS